MGVGQAIALAWLLIGAVFGIMDALDIVQLGFISMQEAACTTSACTVSGVSLIIGFTMDMLVAPALLAAAFMNSGLGLLGVGIGLVILYHAYS